MSDYLVQQALQNIWCAPTQDRQNIIALAKLSRYGGVYTVTRVMWRTYHLPEVGKLYHVYQVGNLSPRQLGLTIPPKAGFWTRMSDVCKNENMIVDLYSVNGIQSPRFAAWYMVTDDNDLIVALEDNPKIPINYNEETLYLRVYNNAYYDSVRHNPSTDFIEVKGTIVRTSDEILAFQHDYDAAVARGGYVYAFVNGMLVDSINLLNVKNGDAVEYIYDGSIYAVEDLPVNELMQFDSVKDAKRKYLLHSGQADKTNITYHDDVEVYLTHANAAGGWSGIYYHRNQPDAIRQVTHVDYSISIPYLNSYANSQPSWGDISQMTVRLMLRKSGFRRPLVNEANRIKELYKLPDVEILPAMVGVDANVPEWQAGTLENSSYPKIMGSVPLALTSPLVQDAYGYNAMSQLLAPTPQFTKNISGQTLVDIPPNLRFRSTVYEYDFDGHLLGWYTHALGDLWRCVNDNCHLVEIITGYAVTRLDEKYGQQAGTLDANLDYRMYTCNVSAGVPDNKWVDVTDSSKYVVSATGGLNWLTNPYTTYTMVRSNRDFLGYDLNIPLQGGALRFILSSEQNRNHGYVNTLMQVSMGELDLWLNGKALVEGIDYIVNFPEIVIINKKFINYDPEVLQKITVRFCGHCKSDLSRAVLGDRGFIEHGVLSNNNKFDIRDDKVLHINVGGAVYDRSELSFAETHSGVNVPGVANGTPYVVRDIVVPLRGTINAKTYDLRDKALATDKHVSDYMTAKLPPPVFTEINSITDLYPVYSPFVSSLIDDLLSGVLVDDRMLDSYNDNILQDMCKFYEPLLAFDPTRDPNKVDGDYVSVHPYYGNNVVELRLYQFRFVARAIKLYLNDAVDLSHFVTVVA